MRARICLLISISLNVLLASVALSLIQRPATRGLTTHAPHRVANPAVPYTIPATQPPPSPAEVVISDSFDWSEVASLDLTQYVANLQAIECPREVIREIILAVVNENFVRQRHEVFAPLHARFWELMAEPDHAKGNPDLEKIDERSRELQQARRATLEAVLGSDWRDGVELRRFDGYHGQSPLAFLSGDKQQLWFELDAQFQKDRQEVMQQTRGNSEEQKARLAALEQARLEARRQLLTPDEFGEYSARSSAQGGWSQNLVAFEATEEEFRWLNQLRAATPTNHLVQFDTQVLAGIGPERFAALQRSQDPRFVELWSLERRCQLPVETVLELYRLRVAADQQAELVRTNRQLPPDLRRELLAAVQLEAHRQILQALGQTAGEAYFRNHGQWLKAIEDKAPSDTSMATLSD